MALALVTLLVLFHLDGTSAKSMTIKVAWAIPPSVPSVPAGRKWTSSTWTLDVCQGDTVNISWNGMTHSLYSTTSSKWASCTLSGTALVPAATSGSKSLTYRKRSTYYYLCTVPTHCASGLKLKVVVGKAC